MTEAYDGRQVVGIDLHRRRTVIVRMTEDGRKLGTARISNSAEALRKEIARAGTSPRVVLEATYGWYWAADVLAGAGAEVHLAHPLGVKAFSYRRVKNDERDAADLADLLRTRTRPMSPGQPGRGYTRRDECSQRLPGPPPGRGAPPQPHNHLPRSLDHRLTGTPRARGHGAPALAHRSGGRTEARRDCQQDRFLHQVTRTSSALP